MYRLASLMAAVVLVSSAPAFAQGVMKAPGEGITKMDHADGMDDMKAAGEGMMNAEATMKAVEVGNKICPVGGEKIEEGKASKFEYNGKIYNLCCAMCEKDFKKDPAKYIKKVEEEMSVKK